MEITKIKKIELVETAFKLMLKGYSFRGVAKELNVSAQYISNLVDYIWEYAKTHPERRNCDNICYQIHHTKDRFEMANRRASFYYQVIEDWKTQQLNRMAVAS